MSEAMRYTNVFIVCMVLAVLTVVIHMAGLYKLRHWIHRLLQTQSFQHHVMRETLVVSALVVGLCIIHLTEVLAWAGGYMAMAAFGDFADAFYYSLTTYTTVGADGLNIGRNFRIVAGFESLLGPMMLAWSTAFLVEYVSQVLTSNNRRFQDVRQTPDLHQ
ncbi:MULTISPECIES: ion channel [unclassified Xanthobacter]|uniref:ion channel n=1 Tax=unclassified Xanthobacter TaxID=2623496 RepID=UPI001F202EEA|nr:MULTISPECIES: ion channel [unclassified Xanthobacter]